MGPHYVFATSILWRRLLPLFIVSLSDNNQTDIIQAFDSNSRYLDDLLSLDNPYFEQMVGQIYHTELQ